MCACLCVHAYVFVYVCFALHWRSDRHLATIFPVVQEVVEELRVSVPRRLQCKHNKKGGDVVDKKLASCIEDTRRNKCRRAVM